MPVIAKTSLSPSQEELDSVAAEIDQAVVKALAEAANLPTTSEDGTVVLNGFKVRKANDGVRVILEGI